ncbi:hypothetical protein GUITHDRAFT_117173 [Guillardia theta CCMP2712]|uniref:Zn(2)-C6 fungal-type domain-containing protein n=1 Tax=Guillardia theta (strain CCMP2712) TaxID=905079 RepID=L1IK52_GUITC|nr:hypothetical protein GUITHDRAFT_117173 [Guillardia theta CCMP2712]EKX36628.1 hypothetical protein GUITHDRAFT_117173 [Guillardia theta CCMP2712]|eukprot:XP_005823608.1 hypothetical protein GUITHDRAFT_117173 [Guillardia theta CCMP2712]
MLASPPVTGVLSSLICSSPTLLPPGDCIPSVDPKSNLSASSLDDAISQIVVEPHDLASFIDFADLEPSSNDEHAEFESTSVPACEAEEEGTAAALPLLVATTLDPAITWFEAYRFVKNNKHTKQACVSCRQKKQKCEDGRPCHRCINAHRKCTDDDTESLKRRRLDDPAEAIRRKRALLLGFVADHWVDDDVWEEKNTVIYLVLEGCVYNTHSHAGTAIIDMRHMQQTGKCVKYIGFAMYTSACICQDLEPSSNDEHAEFESTSVPACEAEEEGTAAALPTLNVHRSTNNKHTKQACVSCRQKKQTCILYQLGRHWELTAQPGCRALSYHDDRSFFLLGSCRWPTRRYCTLPENDYIQLKNFFTEQARGSGDKRNTRVLTFLLDRKIQEHMRLEKIIRELKAKQIERYDRMMADLTASKAETIKVLNDQLQEIPVEVDSARHTCMLCKGFEISCIEFASSFETDCSLPANPNSRSCRQTGLLYSISVFFGPVNRWPATNVLIPSEPVRDMLQLYQNTAISISTRLLLTTVSLACSIKTVSLMEKNYKSITYKSITYKSITYKSITYKSITYKSITYKSITYKSITYTSITYKSITYKSITYKSSQPTSHVNDLQVNDLQVSELPRAGPYVEVGTDHIIH